MCNLVKFSIKTLGFFLLLMLSFSLNSQNDIKNLKTAVDSNQTKDIKAIVAHFDQLYRGQSSYAKMEMQIATPHWERTLGLEVWAEGMDKTFILITSPKKEKGIATLRIKNEMWNYLPKTNKVMKIPPSMMMGSWMGSDFTNDDLVKESSNAEDYEHKLLGQSEIDGQTTYQIELTPKPSAPVVWSRIVQWVRGGDYIPVKAEFYNSRGELSRSIIYSTIKQMDDRQIPTKIEIVTRVEFRFLDLIEIEVGVELGRFHKGRE